MWSCTDSGYGSISPVFLVHLPQDQMRAWAGMSGSISQAAVVTGICCCLVVNAAFYLFFMHVVYLILLTVRCRRVEEGLSSKPKQYLTLEMPIIFCTGTLKWRDACCAAHGIQLAAASKAGHKIIPRGNCSRGLFATLNTFAQLSNT